MFVQFIEGTIADPTAFRTQLDRWQQELASGAPGWLGTTAGVTDEGTAFVAARFASADAARANSDRPEQSAWWEQTERLFEGPVAFTDCEDPLLLRGGGSDDAGFVQVIRGEVADPARARGLFAEELPDDVRPDVLGGLVGLQHDGTYAMVVYFTSEAEARAGEMADPEEGMGEDMASLHRAPPRYLDIRDPWLWSA